MSVWDSAWCARRMTEQSSGLREPDGARSPRFCSTQRPVLFLRRSSRYVSSRHTGRSGAGAAELTSPPPQQHRHVQAEHVRLQSRMAQPAPLTANTAAEASQSQAGTRPVPSAGRRRLLTGSLPLCASSVLRLLERPQPARSYRHTSSLPLRHRSSTSDSYHHTPRLYCTPRIPLCATWVPQLA